jgi:hypothetical protein
VQEDYKKYGQPGNIFRLTVPAAVYVWATWRVYKIDAEGKN